MLVRDELYPPQFHGRGACDIVHAWCFAVLKPLLGFQFVYSCLFVSISVLRALHRKGSDPGSGKGGGGRGFGGSHVGAYFLRKTARWDMKKETKRHGRPLEYRTR